LVEGGSPEAYYEASDNSGCLVLLFDVPSPPNVYVFPWKPFKWPRRESLPWVEEGDAYFWRETALFLEEIVSRWMP